MTNNTINDEVCAVREDAHREMERLLHILHPDGRQPFCDALSVLSGTAINSDLLWSLFTRKHQSPYKGLVPPITTGNYRFVPESDDPWDTLYNTAIGVLCFGLEPSGIQIKLPDGVSMHIDKLKVTCSDIFEDMHETEWKDRECLRSWERDEYAWWLLWLRAATSLLATNQGSVHIEANPRIGDPDAQHLAVAEIKVHPRPLRNLRTTRKVARVLSQAYRKFKGSS